VSAALHQSWPPFALIAGLLLIGLLAHRDGLFAWGGARLQRLPGGGAALLAGALALDALVTAILNLDTAVVFLTPVLVLAARRRRLAVEPFLFGCVFMANASSLFLPGSNLTNLLVLGGERRSGGAFAGEMLPLALTAALVTALGLLVLFRRQLRGGTGAGAADGGGGCAEAGAGSACSAVAAPSSAAAGPGSIPELAEATPADDPRLVLGVGLLATAAATVLVLALSQPAAAVLAVGVAATASELARGRLDRRQVWAALGPFGLAAAFVLTVLLGTLARHWNGPAELVAGASGPETAIVAALTAVLVNNLPAAALYSAHAVDHSRMLLLGLNVGPNLAVTGALSALLWFRAARQVGERPSLLDFSRRGIPLAAAALAAAILVGSF
jgi:arsenical pump membrane protein